MNEPEILCIIGARQGSRRLPGKNRQELAGQPLYRHTLKAARQSMLFGQIIFSTDDPEILDDLSQDADSRLILDNRPKSLAGEQTIFWETCAYLLEKYAAETSSCQDLCMLTPCHPFRQAHHLTAAFNCYRKAQAISLVSITPFPSPPECRIIVNTRGWAERTYSTPLRKAEHPESYYPNGAITFVRKAYFIQHQEVFSPRTLPFELPWPYCLDIDEQNDLDLARQLVHSFLDTGTIK